MTASSLYTGSQLSPSRLSGEGMLVVIDLRVTALDQLVAGVKAGAQVLVLDAERGAIAQITQFLTHHTGFESLHLIGHGQSGAMQLGTTLVDTAELLRHETAVRSWSKAFISPDFDLLLYGCEVAKGDRGQVFLHTLHQLTGANLAASEHAIGATPVGPNWQLEQFLDQPKTPLALSATVQSQYPGTLATFNVSSTTDLINSIQSALSNSEADTINLAAGTTFDITSAFTGNTGTAFPTQASTGPTGLPIITDTFGITIKSATTGTKSTIQRNSSDDFRIFAIAENAKLTLEDVIIRNGKATDTTTTFGDDGGGLLNVGGTVTITNSEVNDNSASDDGGGILNVGTGSVAPTMTITGSTISGNASSFESGSAFDDGGGGIDNDGNLRNGGKGANMTITDSTITGNNANSGAGGGLRAWDGSSLTITNTTVTNNQAGQGGGLAAGSDDGNVPILDITDSTFTGNTDSTGEDDDTAVVGNVSDEDVGNAGNFSGNDVGTAGGFDDIVEGDAPTEPTIRVTLNSDSSIIADEDADVNLGDFLLNETGTATTFTIENLGAADLTITGLTSADTTKFTVSNFSTGTLAQNETTTFTITPADTATLGAIASTQILFTTNDTTNTDGGEFDFTVTGEVVEPTPVIQVTLNSDSSIVVDEDADVDLGDFLLDGTPTDVTFTVANLGTADLTITGLTSADDTKFTVSSFSVTTLAPNETTTFTITPVDTSTEGAIDATQILFTTNDTANTDGGDGEFDFTVTGEVVDETDLTVSGSTFSIGKFVAVEGETMTLQLTVESSSRSQVETLEVDAGGEPTLFSVLPNSFLPNAFGISDQQFFWTNIESDQTGVNFSIGGIAPEVTEIEAASDGSSQFRMAFDLDSDGSADDLSILVDRVSLDTNLLLGASAAQQEGNEILDLSGETGSFNATFTLYREAAFNNTVGLYRIDDESGAIGGIAPGASGYAQAAVTAAQDLGIFLSVGDGQTGSASGSLTGGELYAPLIVVDSTIDNFLSNGGTAYFIYEAANSDGVDHIKLLGTNTFGFEDLAGGGDQDFNDLIFQVDLAVA